MLKHQDFPVRRALISVSDKTNLAEFAKRLELLGIEIVSTGGTATFLRDAGIPVIPVSQVTNFPEIFWKGGSRRSIPPFTAASWPIWSKAARARFLPLTASLRLGLW